MTLDIAHFADLRDRDLSREGFMIGEGRLVASRMLASDCDMVGVVCSPDNAAEFEGLAAGRCPVKVVGEAEISQVAGYPFHRGVLAAAKLPPAQGWGEFQASCGKKAQPCRFVVCPDVGDSENLGSVYRCAAALGWDAVLVGPRCASPYGRRALRASMGASLSLPTVQLRDCAELDQLSAKGCLVLGTSLKPEAQDLDEIAGQLRALGAVDSLTVPIALLFGNEYRGLAPEWEARCQRLVRIPMFNGTDSLNLAVAAGICLHALGPRRN